jgi:hypothetical protein
MMMRHVHKLLLCLHNPVVGRYLSTRIAETTLTGVGDIVLRPALTACIQAISEHLFIPTVHHLPHILLYACADIVYTRKRFPLILEYSLERMLACYLFQH